MAWIERFGKLAASAGLALATSAAAAPTLLVFGDSLSAGYGLDPGSGWVALLDNKLHAQAAPKLNAWKVVNASVSGETTSGGLARLPAALAQCRPQVVAIELGGNDGLRGTPLKLMRDNLERMIDLVRAAKAQALLFEMRIPSNYGPAYTESFRRTFTEVAQARHVDLVPFFLMPLVADRARWFQDDALHPNKDAQPLMLEAVWPALSGLLEKAASSASSKATRP